MIRVSRYTPLAAVLALSMASCGSDDGGGGAGRVASSATTQCGAEKLEAAAEFCLALFSPDAGSGRAEFDAAWGRAEAKASAAGLGCSDLALTSDQATDILGAARDNVQQAVVGAGGPAAGECTANVVAAAGTICDEMLKAEGGFLRQLPDGSADSERGRKREGSRIRFLESSDRALGTACVSGGAAEARLVSNAARVEMDRVVDELAAAVLSAFNLGTTGYVTVSPTGSVDYQGQTLTAQCIDGSPYHFFAKRGTVNKLVMYYQGGGACWEKLTCGVPVCDDNVDPNGNDNPNNFSTGFTDISTPGPPAPPNLNPFKDWHAVYVSYCSCDIHFGDAAQDYVNSPDDTAPLHVEHRGYHNARVAEKWAREHFIAPEDVFVTGSSAGAYGAWFHAPLLHDAFPASQFHVLADAGNGVITNQFLNDFFPNWNFDGNLPDDIPEIRQVLDDDLGIVGYTEVVAKQFPNTNWAHYSTAFDGGSGGQTGFYNLMLNDNNPLDALTWWEGSCQFNEVMRDQVMETHAAVPNNYRYYIGTGSRHTMWGSDKVYDDVTGDVPTIVSWVNAMLDSDARSVSPDWVNVECEDCGLLLPGDPAPDPLEPPFMTRVNEVGEEEVAIVCE